MAKYEAHLDGKELARPAAKVVVGEYEMPSAVTPRPAARGPAARRLAAHAPQRLVVGDESKTPPPAASDKRARAGDEDISRQRKAPRTDGAAGSPLRCAGDQAAAAGDAAAGDAADPSHAAGALVTPSRATPGAASGLVFSVAPPLAASAAAAEDAAAEDAATGALAARAPAEHAATEHAATEHAAAEHAPANALAALRGKPQGVKVRQPSKCSVCHKTGHTKTQCLQRGQQKNTLILCWQQKQEKQQ